MSATGNDNLLKVIRWENTRTARFYEVRVQRNLFGDWEVLSVWGGIGSRQGGHKCLPIIDLAAGAESLADVERRRVRRGYSRCS